MRKIELQTYECPECGGCGAVGWFSGHTDKCSFCNGFGFVYNWPERGQACPYKECNKKRKQNPQAQV